MKKLLVALLVLGGCSSWEQRDFEKELKKSDREGQPVVALGPKDEKLLEKFEVLKVDETNQAQGPIAEKGTEIKAPEKKKTVSSVVVKNIAGREGKALAKPVSEIVTMKPLVKSPPKDYPAHLFQINEKAKKVWDIYRPNHVVDQKVFLDIHYLGMTVGKIVAMNKGKKMINGREVWHFHARFKSAPFYSNIYELDDTVDTYVTTENFLSQRFSLIQRESSQDIDDLQLHDRDLFKSYWFYHQKRKNGKVKDKKEEGYIPYFSTDPFSVLFLYQGLPLKNGDVYEIPLINKAKILILRSEVEGRETLNTEKGKIRAIRLHATTKYTGETLKSGDLYFWFSDDTQRRLVKAQAKIKIGSVTADLADN